MNATIFTRVFILTGIFIIACTAWESCQLPEEDNQQTEEEQYLELLNMMTSDKTAEPLLNEGYELESTFIENQDAIYPDDQTVYDAGAIWFKNSESDYHFVVAVLNNYASRDEAIAAMNGDAKLNDVIPQAIGDTARQSIIDYKNNRIANALAFVRNSCYVFISSCSSDTLSPAADFTMLYSMAAKLDSGLIKLGPLKYKVVKQYNHPDNGQSPESPYEKDYKSMASQRWYQFPVIKNTRIVGTADVRFKATLNIEGDCFGSCEVGGENVYCHPVILTGELVRFHLNQGESDGDPVAWDGDILLRGNVIFTYECSVERTQYESFDIGSEIGDITDNETLAGDISNTAEPMEGMWPVLFISYPFCQCPAIERIILNSLVLEFHDNDSGGALDIISEAVKIFMEYNDRFKIIKFSNPTSLKIHLIYGMVRLIGKYIVVPIWDDINFVGGVYHEFNADERELPWGL